VRIQGEQKAKNWMLPAQWVLNYYYYYYFAGFFMDYFVCDVIVMICRFVQ